MEENEISLSFQRIYKTMQFESIIKESVVGRRRMDSDKKLNPGKIWFCEFQSDDWKWFDGFLLETSLSLHSFVYRFICLALEFKTICLKNFLAFMKQEMNLWDLQKGKIICYFIICYQKAKIILYTSVKFL